MEYDSRDDASLFTIYFDQTVKGEVQNNIKQGILTQLENNGINVDTAIAANIPQYTSDTPELDSITFELGGMRSANQTRARELNGLQAMFSEAIIEACQSVDAELAQSVSFVSNEHGQNFFTREAEAADIA
ncbi:MAG: hypothetical protein ACRBCK_06350 [Alphaproteobacteria bacterium]